MSQESVEMADGPVHVFNFSDWPALLDRHGACAYLSIGRNKLQELVQERQVRPVLVKGLVRYRRHELDQLIQALPSRRIRERQEKVKAAQAARAQESAGSR